MSDLQPSSQESERIGSGWTLGITVWVLIFGALLSIAAGLLLSARSRTLRVAPSMSRAVRPEPEVSNVRTELFAGAGAGERLKAEQRATLRHYAWVDRQGGIVRIPIDVAIELESKAATR
jgi:hypothetical protein